MLVPICQTVKWSKYLTQTRFKTSNKISNVCKCLILLATPDSKKFPRCWVESLDFLVLAKKAAPLPTGGIKSSRQLRHDTPEGQQATSQAGKQAAQARRAAAHSAAAAVTIALPKNNTPRRWTEKPNWTANGPPPYLYLSSFFSVGWLWIIGHSGRLLVPWPLQDNATQRHYCQAPCLLAKRRVR